MSEVEIPSLAPELESLAGLVGRWEGEGEGGYPTIEPFRYRELIVFSHFGKPFLAYSQRTVNLATGLPSHAETGYWRSAGGDRVELVLAHPTGLVEVAGGSVEAVQGGLRVAFASESIARTPTAKEVTAIERRFELRDDELRYTLSMAAVGQHLQHHLDAVLHRAG